VAIEESDVRARFPTLDRYRASQQPDWSDQIAAAKVDALTAFREQTQVDPLWAKAVDTDSWKRILGLCVIVLVWRAQPGEVARAEEARWAEAAQSAIATFQYVEDVDRDGVISEIAVEETRRAVDEIALVR
jgi:hypothetical protein